MVSSKGTNVSGIARTDTTHKIPAGGRIHNLLYNGIVLFKGQLPRKEIEGTEFTARHIAQAEILGLIARDLPYRDCRGKEITYTITPLGYKAFEKLHVMYYWRDKHEKISVEEVNIQIALGAIGGEFHRLYTKPMIYVVVDVEINQIAYDYHKNKTW